MMGKTMGDLRNIRASVAFTVLVAICVAAAAVEAQSSAAAPHCTSVGGTVTTNFIDENTTLGTATGDLRGAVSAALLGVAPAPDGNTIFTVQHHWTTDSGDTIAVTVAQATAAPFAPGQFGIVSYPVNISGGTGRFATATGLLQNIGVVDLNTGRTVFRYSGQICLQAPLR
jgi:hypothetical protein